MAYAEACKASYTGSTPVLPSIWLHDVKAAYIPVKDADEGSNPRGAAVVRSKQPAK